MLLTADVGNTNIKLGLFDGDEFTCKIRFSTDTCQTSDEFAVELYTFFQIYKIDAQSITSSIISSVVPKVTYPLKTAIQTVTGAKSFIVSLRKCRIIFVKIRRLLCLPQMLSRA